MARLFEFGAWQRQLLNFLAIGPATDTFDITPSDTNNFTNAARSIYVGTAGDIKLVTLEGTVQLFKNVPVGILAVSATRVNQTGTGASNLVGLI